MLDVARHFMPKEGVLRYLDLMAAHKLNVFHFHLTDDQGWRVQIERYPKLTEIGSWRARTKFGHRASPLWDDKPHGGYYTQDDIREIVAYAAERHITVVPEIDVPGHSQAAIAAYPELGNTDVIDTNSLSVWDTWGINPNVLAPTDNTLRFYEGVFEELLELFPGSSFTSAATNASRTSGSSRRPRRRASRNSVSRTRTSCSRGSSDTSTSGSPRAGEGSSAGTRSWRAGSRTAPSCRRGAATRAGSPRPARATTSSCALSSTCTWTGGRPRRGRAGADRPCAHPGGRLSLRAGSRAAHRGRGRSCAGRAGQRVDRGDGGSRTRGLPDVPRLAAFAEVAWSALPAPAERDFADFERRMAAHYPRLDALGSPTVRPPDPCRGSAAPESSDAPRTARPRTPRNPGERLEHGREKGSESHR